MTLACISPITLARATLLADYIVQDDNEREDYERSCEEHGLDPSNYIYNASLDAPHVYAAAKVFLEETEDI